MPEQAECANNTLVFLPSSPQADGETPISLLKRYKQSRYRVLENIIPFLGAGPDGPRLRSEIDLMYVSGSLLLGRGGDRSRQKAMATSFEIAVEAFGTHDYESAWNNILEARRSSYFLMTEEELNVEYRIVAGRGQKTLSGWREKAFSKLIEDFKATRTANALYGAAQIISDAQESKFHKINLAKYQSKLLCIILATSIILFIISSIMLGLSRADAFVGQGGSIVDGFVFFPVFAIGCMGACVSALISFAPRETDKIPDRLLTFVTTLARPFVGAASAVAGCCLLLSGAVQLPHVTTGFLYTTAFAFGFSERLVKGITGAVENDGTKGTVADQVRRAAD